MDHRDPEWLVRQIGLTRYLKYMQTAQGNVVAVPLLYARDTALRDALRPELEAVEIAIRSRYHHVIQDLRPGLPLWLTDEKLPVHRGLQNHYDKVFRRLSAGEITSGEAVEGLSFGFWTQLTSANFEHPMWTPYLRHVYPARTRRKTVHDKVEPVRRLRNRVHHYDTVLGSPLDRLWTDMLWLLDRLSPELATERRRVSKLPDLLC